MPPFLVCIHDATPAHAHETRMMIRDLAPMLGRRIVFAAVPDWHGRWPLAAHRDYCDLVRENSEERLLHGYFHQRQRGSSGTTWFVDGSDEMNGLGPEETRGTIERGQKVFTDVFGEPARGFLAPAWQQGHVHLANGNELGLEHVLGFFSIESRASRKVSLATWTWHCGRWGWLGHVGHATGWLMQSMDLGVPALAIHPKDIEHGYWPTILRRTRDLLYRGYEPTTVAGLLRASEC